MLSTLIHPALAVAIVAAASAGTSDPSPTSPEAPATHHVEHQYGAVDVPADPERIVVLDEYAAMTLMSLGIEPTLVYGALSSEVGAAVLADAGVEVVPAPTMILEPNFEAIAADEPDLIVMIDTGATLTENYGEFSAIAPTLVLPYEQPWRDGLALAGEAFGRTDDAERIADVLSARIDDVGAALGDPAPTISVLGSWPGEALFSLSAINPISQLLDEVGLARPAPEVGAVGTGASTSAAAFSPELLAEHDADLVAVLDGSYYDADAVTQLPTFATLGAAGDDHVAVVNGEMWTGSFPFAIWWVLDDLDAIAAGEAPATAADAATRWADFGAAVAAP